MLLIAATGLELSGAFIGPFALNMLVEPEMLATLLPWMAILPFALRLLSLWLLGVGRTTRGLVALGGIASMPLLFQDPGLLVANALSSAWVLGWSAISFRTAGQSRWAAFAWLLTSAFVAIQALQYLSAALMFGQQVILIATIVLLSKLREERTPAEAIVEHDRASAT